MIRDAVVIAGAGPTGLMLEGGLTLANVDVAIVERRDAQRKNRRQCRSHFRTPPSI